MVIKSTTFSTHRLGKNEIEFITNRHDSQHGFDHSITLTIESANAAVTSRFSLTLDDAQRLVESLQKALEAK